MWSQRLAAFLTLSFLILPVTARAGIFDFVVSDYDMVETKTMSKETLRRFLLEHGTLGKMKLEDVDHVVKPAYEIIYRAATKYKISPRFLVVLLQREQSLIEDPTPNKKQLDWALGYGVCDACSMDDPAIAPYRGFAHQVEHAARRLREIINTDIIGYRTGVTTVIDGIPVTPQNKATAALYTYTPHLHGNNNFRDIWRRYFLMRYPDGALLQARGEPGVYLIEYGRKRPFASKVALTSRFDGKNVVQVAKTDLLAYEDGPIIEFPNYSLLHGSDDTYYLLVDDTLRPMTKEAFRNIGYSEDELVEIDAEGIKNYHIGTPLDAEHPDTTDRIARTPEGNLFALRDGIRYPIISEEILRDRYGDTVPDPMDSAVIRAMPAGEPVTFRNGTLVKAKGSSTVFLISNGVRRSFVSSRAFSSYGFEFRDVITTTRAALEVHPLGNPIQNPLPTTQLAAE